MATTRQSGKRSVNPAARGRSGSRPRRTAPPASVPAAAVVPALDDLVARTIESAQSIGRDLGAVGLAAAKGTMSVAYDMATAIGQAAQSLVSGTVEAAEAIVRRAGELVPPAPAQPAVVRKPLAKAGQKPRPRVRQSGPRRATGS